MNKLFDFDFDFDFENDIIDTSATKMVTSHVTIELLVKNVFHYDVLTFIWPIIVT